MNVPASPTPRRPRTSRAAVVGYPDAKVQTREQWIDKQDQDFNQFLIMLYVLLALSVIVSVFGMVNTLVLSVFERTRELGMLRAVGMTRRQVRRMVRHESVITALIGAALGLPLGIFLAALVTRALQEFDVRFEVPVGPAGLLRDRRGRRRDPGRDPAGAARRQAQRAPGVAVRVAVIGVALKGLRRAQAPATLTALAIVLGVAMISGTYVLTDTIDRRLRRDLRQGVRAHRRRHHRQGRVRLERGSEEDAPPFRGRPRGRPAASRRRGRWGRSRTRPSSSGSDGKADVCGGAPNSASADPDGDQRLNPLDARSRRLAPRPSQIAIDEATADQEDSRSATGSACRARPGQRFDISGIVTFGGLESIGGATLAGFDLPTAQRLFDKEGLDFI